MSIKDNALLVSLSITKPQLSAKDDKATGDAERANNAQGAGQYRKDLYPKHLIAPIQEVESEARIYMRSTTYPWSRGDSLLPATRFMQFADRMATYEVQFMQNVTAFLNNWANVQLAAQQAQGGLYDPGQYPDLSEIRNRFSFRVLYHPVTDTRDFRVQLQEQELERLRETTERQMVDALDDILKEPLRRLREVVSAVATRTGTDRTVVTKDGGIEVRAAVFRDSLIENLVEEIALLKDFAPMLPANVVALADEASTNLHVAPEALRTDPDLRKRVSVDAKKLLGAIEEMLS